ncbi:MAG TPA: M23 family metallopeptidase, partial [Rhizomicrobium sp.]
PVLPARRIRILRCEMNEQSFYTSAVAAGIDDRLIADIAAAFTFDFDFVREIHPGDVFEAAVAETLDVGGHAVGKPQLLYVSLVTAAKSRALYRFQIAPGAPPEWYDGDGRSTRRGLMRTPVDGARVTSTFGMRDHPVLGYTRMHKGVDFGTPVGTPVYASGDGVVDAIGPHTGYGNYLRIVHGPKLATAYGHLSGYPQGIAIGTRVHQGEVVAFSGNTGVSTGPHLHYEIIENGGQVDPLQYKTQVGVSLAGSALAEFRTERDRIDALRAQAM